MSSRWFILHVAPNREGQVRRRLAESERLYPGYLLARLEAGQATPGVIKAIGPLSEEEVASARARVAVAPRAVSVEFDRGERVRVREGAFEGLSGVVEGVVPEKGLVRVSMVVFGRATPVELDYWKVEKQ